MTSRRFGWLVSGWIVSDGLEALGTFGCLRQGKAYSSPRPKGGRGSE
jgi:hypothetical protein